MPTEPSPAMSASHGRLPVHTGERTSMSTSRREARRLKIGEQSNLGLRSNFVIAQNVIGALLAVPVLVTGVIVAQQKSATNTKTSILKGDECASFMEKPVIAVGILLLVVSLFGVAMALLANSNGDNFNVPSLSRLASWLQLLILFCLVILLFCFSIFALEITNNGLSHTVRGYGQTYNEYRLNEYPKWMRRRVENPNYWNKAKRCLPGVCQAGHLPASMTNVASVSLNSLTPIEGGCCIAPAACNITYIGVPRQIQRNKPLATMNYATNNDTIMINGTMIDVNQSQSKISTKCNNDNKTYTKLATNSTIISPEKETNPKMGNEVIHLYTHDCNKWSSVPNKLCFDCDTCKAGMIQASMDRWKTAGYVYVSLVMVMIVQYALFACYGFQEKDHH